MRPTIVSVLLITTLVLAGCGAPVPYGQGTKPPGFFFNYGYIFDVISRNNAGFEQISQGQTEQAQQTFVTAARLLQEAVETHEALLSQSAPAGRPAAAALEVFSNIETDGERSCTGFFISPRVVMTAAHCVRRSEKSYAILMQRMTQPEMLVNGLQQRARVTNVRFPPDMVEAAPCHPNDFAFLTVSHESGAYIPLHTGKLTAGTPLISLGYPGDLNGTFFLRMDLGCSVSEVSRAGFFRSNCESYYGNSGGPTLIRRSDGTLAAAGILSCGKKGGSSREDDATGHVSVGRAMAWNPGT